MAISTDYKSLKEKGINIEDHLEWNSETIDDTNYYTNKEGIEVTISPVKHFPDLKEYEVWMEGYAATGERGGAHLWGKAYARNFAQACHIVAAESKLKHIKEENNSLNKDYVSPSRWDYDPSRLTYWGCNLHWSEEKAKKSFG